MVVHSDVFAAASSVELAELLELTATLMKKTSRRLMAPTTYEDLKSH